MFWKKKSEDTITIELEQDDRRKNVRIQPLNPIFIDYEEQTFQVIDISSAGLAFESPKLKGKNTLDISIHIPAPHPAINENIAIVCSVKILHTYNSIFHCQFIHLRQEQQRQLDQFILNEQKRQIRSKNA